MKKLLLLISSVLLITISQAQFTHVWDSVGNGVLGSANCVKAMTVNDTGNAIYTGGSFRTAEGKICNNIAEWRIGACGSCYNTNGSWAILSSGVNKQVTALTMLGNKLIAGGSFDTAGGMHVNNIAVWSSLLAWYTWDSLAGGVNGQVYALTSLGTNLYAGGNFTTAGKTTANRVAQWNGSVWSALGSGFDSGTVYCLAMYYDTLFAGGSFTSSNGVTLNHIAKWNGTAWLPVGGGMNNTVYSLCVYNGALFAGGAFTNAGGITASYIALWNLTSWSAAYGGTNDTVRAMIPAGNTYGVIMNKKLEGNPNASGMVVVGSFTKVGSPAAASPYAALYVANGLGSLPPGWISIAGLNKPAYALASTQSDNYVGGFFDTITSAMWSNIKSVNHLAQFTFVIGGGINELYNNNEVNIYPNPSSGVYTAVMKDQQIKIKSVEVYNMMGEMVSEQFIASTGQFTIDLKSQPAGIYLYRIIDNSGAAVTTGKLVVER